MKTLKTLFALALVTVIGMSSAFAGPGDKAATAANKAKVQKQIVHMIQDSDMETTLDGEALITFMVDDYNELHVKGVFGTNEDLITHIENSLEGEKVRANKNMIGKEYKMKVKFQDLR